MLNSARKPLSSAGKPLHSAEKTSNSAEDLAVADWRIQTALPIASRERGGVGQSGGDAGRKGRRAQAPKQRDLEIRIDALEHNQCQKRPST